MDDHDDTPIDCESPFFRWNTELRAAERAIVDHVLAMRPREQERLGLRSSVRRLAAAKRQLAKLRER